MFCSSTSSVCPSIGYKSRRHVVLDLLLQLFLSTIENNKALEQLFVTTDFSSFLFLCYGSHDASKTVNNF